MLVSGARSLTERTDTRTAALRAENSSYELAFPTQLRRKPSTGAPAAGAGTAQMMVRPLSGVRRLFPSARPGQERGQTPRPTQTVGQAAASWYLRLRWEPRFRPSDLVCGGK